MKKTIAATLAAMLVMTMVACGENDTTDAEQATNSDNQADSQEYAGGDSDNGDNGTWYQINLADYLATEGTKREITNLKTNESNTYPGWTTSDDQTAFETNIPDTMIHQKEGNLTWTLALTVDGEEIAHCPADGDADLK